MLGSVKESIRHPHWRQMAISQVTEPGASFRDNSRNGLDWVSPVGVAITPRS